jgi:putative peptidoglycan lipid II flippase
VNTPSQSAAAAKKRRKVSVGNVAALLIATSFAGQILGFLRTKLVNGNFPTVGPRSTDAYFAAFNVPDLFYYTIAAGALGVAFMPMLSDHLYKGDRKGMWEIANSLMNFLAILMFFVGIIILLFAGPLIRHIVAPGLSGPQLHTATQIMRIIAFNPLLFTLSGVLQSAQQTMGRFFFYAISPLFYNACIIASIFIFRNNIGLVGLGYGALFGAIVQLLVIMAGLYRLGYDWKPRINWRHKDFKAVLRNLPPRSLDQGMDQIESVVETHVASGLGSGNISYYNNAYILSSAPILLIGTAISTAAFPRLNLRLSQNRPDLFRKDFLQIIRAMIWISAPLVVLCYFCRGYLARLIYANGSPQIATVFGFLTMAIFFRILYSIISRWFYSNKDTKTPMFVSIFTISLNVILAITLSRPGRYGVSGLAIAQSVVAAVEVFILTVIMLIRDPKLFDWYFWGGVFRIIAVTGFSVIASFIMISIYPLGYNDKGIVTLGSKLFFIAGVTYVVHVGVSVLFDLEEARPVINRIRKILYSPVKIDLN